MKEGKTFFVLGVLFAAFLIMGCGGGGEKSEIRKLPADFIRSKFVLVDGGKCVLGGKEMMYHKRTYYDVPAFEIDIYEVTNAQYKEFLDATGHPAPKRDDIGAGEWKNGWYKKGFHNHPVTNVSYFDVKEYVKWKQKSDPRIRLPEYKEWEKAARGIEEFKWPWGNTFSVARCNINYRFQSSKNKEGTCPVDELPDGKSPFGCFHMCGNVAEWTATKDKRTAGFHLCGGPNLTSMDQESKIYNRMVLAPKTVSSKLGFRIARSAK